jgi:hypothetical protein
MRRATRAIRAKRVAPWERRGLTAAAFAMRAAVNAHTLTYWKRRLKGAAPALPTRVGFGEVVPPMPRAEGRCPAVVDLTSPGGYRLRVPDDVGCDRLRALLDVLEARR